MRCDDHRTVVNLTSSVIFTTVLWQVSR